MAYYCVENLLNPETFSVAITVSWGLCGRRMYVCTYIWLRRQTDSLLEIMACVFVLAVFHGGEMCEEVQCLNFRVNVMLWRQTQDLWGRSHLRGIAVLAGASSRITTFKTHWRQFTDRLKEKEERERGSEIQAEQQAQHKYWGSIAKSGNSSIVFKFTCIFTKAFYRPCGILLFGVNHFLVSCSFLMLAIIEI